MELFKNTRLKFGKNILNKKITRNKRRIYYSNIDLVNTIGIVWDASRPEEFISLTRFHLKMQERNIDVKILGFFPGKNLPDQFTAIRFLTFFRKGELNLFYIPVCAECNSFINKKFDILIDINFRKLFPLHYISALSNSAFKVGLYDSETNDSPFDLMMEIKNPVDIENYLNQIVQYLTMINSGTAKTVNI
jgi:hypothetical protein